MQQHYFIAFYVPETHVEEVKEAMFVVGAGQLGNYERVAWQVKGEGQFCPKAGSQPYLGKVNELERVAEYRVEMICKTEAIKAVLKAFKEAHPYEEPAYQVIKLEEF